MEQPLIDLTFEQAFNLYLETHSPFIQERTIDDYTQYGRPLLEYFRTLTGEDGQPLTVKGIGPMTIRGYQLWRSKERGQPQPSSYSHRAGNVRIRNEINGVLKPLLKEAGLWEDIKKRKFKHLPVPLEGSGMFLDKEDQREILEVAFSDHRWMLPGHCLRIMYRSGCGFGELRKVRHRDVDLEAGTISIVLGAKNHRRERTLKLVPSALDSLRWIMRRADQMGATNRNDFILPHRSCLKNRHGSFDRPMVGIHRAWVAIRKAWIRKHPEKKHKSEARVYDARVSAATVLMSNSKLSLEVIDKVLGWRPNSRMRQRYLQSEQAIMLEAMNTLEDA